MSFFSRIRRFFSKGAVVEPSNITPEPRYPQEHRHPFSDPEIEALLPPGYRVEFVENSQSALRFDPDHWVTNRYSDLNLWNNQDLYSIEVLSQYGKPVAAVGWHARDDDNESASTFGTFVADHLQRRGLGRALWKAMIRTLAEEEGIHRVHGCAASDKGFTLLTSMKELFPDVVTFDNAYGYGNLKDLRPNKKGRAA